LPGFLLADVVQFTSGVEGGQYPETQRRCLH